MSFLCLQDLVEMYRKVCTVIEGSFNFQTVHIGIGAPQGEAKSPSNVEAVQPKPQVRKYVVEPRSEPLEEDDGAGRNSQRVVAVPLEKCKNIHTTQYGYTFLRLDLNEILPGKHSEILKESTEKPKVNLNSQ